MTSVFDHGGFKPCPAPFNMAAHVLAHANLTPDKLALQIVGPEGSHDWTYAALKSAVLGTATGLQTLGLEPGARVLLRLSNTVDFPLAYLGALAAGMVPVPTSASLTDREVAHILSTLRPDVVLHDPDVVCPLIPNAINLETLRAMQSLPAADWHMGDPNRLGYIIYTSGTSGTPRAVAHAHRAIWARQMMFEGWYGLREQDRVMHAGALNWTYTLGTGLMDPWTAGATALIPASGTAPAELPALMKRHGASIFAAAPGIYRQILRHHDKLDLPDLRHGLSAGEKLPSRVSRAWQTTTGSRILEAYGISECSTFISQAPDGSAQNDALGRPQNGRRIAIIGPDGPAPRNTEGTIAVRRDDPGLMLGYLDAPEATAAKFQGDWFMTGDQGAMDAHDQIIYLGRADDMMNAGGFRVSPIEVEQVLLEMPGITGAGCAQIEVSPDVHVIAAFYTGPAALDDAALHLYAGSKLARYKQPRLYVHLPALPMGANGKLQRRALAPLYEVRPK
ncbi:benzoate--CoA ligase [Sulfitobacter sp. SK012]|uniref:class I adenylate-forming enzyme family protein n=1 Tax=Sulfitobacter sp. SK012 TaxID=1389005 RepID=UPI000E0AC232|nr:class I adenylate-forming enzyme family protein [Sulfitobacter sp. SK012]AXI46771.1 benzoate--CoA ligase [Sulfitobacter sp. SK012]